MRFWTGGYTARSQGNATGIGILHAGTADDILAGGQLNFAGDAVAADASPSWVSAHPALDVLYAALEDAGTVRAYRRTGELTFEPLGPPVPAGDAVCHIAVAPGGGSLVASCWGDGRVVRMAVDAGGRLSAPVVAAATADPYAADAEPAEFSGAVDLSGSVDPRRNADLSTGVDLSRGADLADAARALRAAAGEAYGNLVPDYDAPAAVSDQVVAAEDAASRVSHAHQALFLPGGLVATTDMGWDLVRFWRSADAELRPAQEVVLPRGSGPRHMVWHPSGHLYVVTELSREVFALAADASGRWRIVAGTSLGRGMLEDDTAAEIAASRDGDFLYAGVRGSNTIATVRVRGAGDALAPVALVDAGAQWPRHHLVVRDTLLVAGQRSDEVVSLALDARTGVPGRVRHRVEVPTPTCLLAATP
ncbi:beta-propeller fold lactonase family protein [uncultured Microbacterium sp.]|uniref:lactonase family protein n=1 Tax=uncultured Microbacterium sp. TaxID=191216 RepID=UPI0028D1F341|nr:beta-propeller fold lactonase family protein [uncultured Microbacterium sp.]